jgi:hypothetical protein
MMPGLALLPLVLCASVVIKIAFKPQRHRERREKKEIFGVKV